jgi:hypothetical protein
MDAERAEGAGFSVDRPAYLKGARLSVEPRLESPKRQLAGQVSMSDARHWFFEWMDEFGATDLKSAYDCLETARARRKFRRLAEEYEVTLPILEKGGVNVVAGSGLDLTCGLLAGAPTPVAVGAGVAVASAAVGTGSAKLVDERSEVTMSDMYFLWKALKHGNHRRSKAVPANWALHRTALARRR